MPIDPEFAAALQTHSMEIDETIATRLEAYARVLWQWNESLNLTRHTSWDLFVGRDLRDCLQLAALLTSGEEVLDLGSGNGIPGIPLAILRGDIDVALAESVAKRASALGEIVAELNLPVPVYGARGEELLEDFRFTTIVSRAVGSIAKFCRWVEPHWASVDRLLLVKGPKWIEERNEARHLGVMASLQMRRVATYPLGLDSEGEGVILQIWPKGSDESRFNVPTSP
jgi:16S rRNA (guanine527-N7)-methyltransferase